MLTSCPSCSTRFRLDRNRFGNKLVSLRCPRCRTIFKVEMSSAPSEKKIKVLVAHSDKALCATIGDILSKEEIDFTLCHDGDTALTRMDSNPPQVAVLDVALPGLYAFEVVDKVRTRPGLGNVRIVLLSSVYNKMAYKRTPSSLYGADDYIEKHHIPDDLVPKIHRLMMNAAPADSSPSDEETAASMSLGDDEKKVSKELFDKANEKIRTAEEDETAVDGGDLGEEKARRLARIIVSDIALYNQDRVEEGVRSGKFFELFSEEIEEGRRLFNQRIAPEIAQKQDYLHQAFIDFIEKRYKEIQS